MFKKLCILLIILLLASGAYSARLVDPISKEIDTEEYVGSVSPGSTLELIFSKELGKFDSLEVNSKLPAGYKATVKDYLESIKVFVLVPEDAINDTYQMNLTLSGKVSEEIQIYFVVSDGLLDASSIYKSTIGAVKVLDKKFALSYLFNQTMFTADFRMGYHQRVIR